jgi:hypothetical protein
MAGSQQSIWRSRFERRQLVTDSVVQSSIGIAKTTNDPGDHAGSHINLPNFSSASLLDDKGQVVVVRKTYARWRVKQRIGTDFLSDAPTWPRQTKRKS